MPFLRNAWYVAMWADDLVPGDLTSRTICDQPIVLFRRLDGSAAAIVDECAHRFAPLSRGRLCGEHVECPYHGLRYDHTGTVSSTPTARGASPPRCTSSRSPSRSATRRSGSGRGQAADASLIPDFSHLDAGAPGVLSKRDWMVLDVDYRLMADNLLDLSQVNFLHDGLLGHSGMVDAEVVIEQDGDTLFVTRTSEAVAPPKLFDLMYRDDAEPVDTWAEMRWGRSRFPPQPCRGVPARRGAPRRDDGDRHAPAHADQRHKCYYHIAAVQLGGLHRARPRPRWPSS